MSPGDFPRPFSVVEAEATAEVFPKLHPHQADELFLVLEKAGDLDPNCETCRTHFYPAIRAGKGMPFAPRHRASSMCPSGKRTHCSCDTCF